MATFKIDAHLHRFVGKNVKRTVIWVRRYARVETAARRAIVFLMLEGEVGDMIECVTRVSGYQCCVVKMTADSKITVIWNRSVVQEMQIQKELQRSR